MFETMYKHVEKLNMFETVYLFGNSESFVRLPPHLPLGDECLLERLYPLQLSPVGRLFQFTLQHLKLSLFHSQLLSQLRECFVRLKYT